MQHVNHHQAISEFHLLMGVICVADATTSLFTLRFLQHERGEPLSVGCLWF